MFEADSYPSPDAGDPVEKPVSWLAGARILVTGAAGALGRELVREARAQGAEVTATGRAPNINELTFSEGVHVIASDLRDPQDCLRLPGLAAGHMGGLDVLINNAAVLTRKPFSDVSAEDLDEAWAVNLRAPVLLMQAALTYLKQGNAPAIVNVVSSAGVSGGIASVSSYAMTKAGLIVATKTVAREYAPFGIRVNAISPPTFDSKMQASLPPEDRQRVRDMNVRNRVATLLEVARTTLFLASSHAGLLTGTTLDATAFVV